MPTLVRSDREAGPSGRDDTRPSSRRAWWRWGRHALTLGFLALVTFLLAQQWEKVEWERVLQSIRSYSPQMLLAAGGLTVASHLLFGAFDQLGKRYVGHKLGVARVAMIAGVCYAFTLNLGALIGGVGFRYRLYSREGLSAPDISKIYALSVVTNWLGYLILLGVVLVWGGLQPPRQWGIPAGMLPVAGVAAWAVAAAYLAMCAVRGRRSFEVRKVEVTVPGRRLALAQVVMSVANWMIMGGILYVLLGGEVDYWRVLAVLLVSAVAGALTHVPAGLGVLETVFLALLSAQVPAHQLLGALLAYRAVYYLGPLVLAVCLYAGLEARARR